MIAAAPNAHGITATEREFHSTLAFTRMMLTTVASASFASRNGANQTQEETNQFTELPDACIDSVHAAHVAHVSQNELGN